MLLDLVQPFLRAAMSLELAEISLRLYSFYYVTAGTIRIFHSSVNRCAFIAPTEG